VFHEDERVELVFREQYDGRRISFLEGKCVLIGTQWRDDVKDGQKWQVAIRHSDTYAVAKPLALIAEASPEHAKPRERLIVAGRDIQGNFVPTSPTKVHGSWIEPEDIVADGERVAFFVDAANVDRAARDAGLRIDWPRLRDYFLGPGRLMKTLYYTVDWGADSEQNEFLERLVHDGFTVIPKRAKRIFDPETNETRVKANIDIELALDMVSMADLYDVAYLLSGDSDFERVLKVLQARGKRVHVVGTFPSMSRELRFASDKPVFYLEHFASQVGDAME